jgi:hypothetical protein
MSRDFGKKLPYCNVNGVYVIPVIKVTNVTYDTSLGTITPGNYAFLMISQGTDTPTVPMLDTIMFPFFEDAYGVEHVLREIFDEIPITSTSQLVVVGEYNGPISVEAKSDVDTDMGAGFAEQYFE